MAVPESGTLEPWSNGVLHTCQPKTLTPRIHPPLHWEKVWEFENWSFFECLGIWVFGASMFIHCPIFAARGSLCYEVE